MRRDRPRENHRRDEDRALGASSGRARYDPGYARRALRAAGRRPRPQRWHRVRSGTSRQVAESVLDRRGAPTHDCRRVGHLQHRVARRQPAHQRDPSLAGRHSYARTSRPQYGPRPARTPRAGPNRPMAGVRENPRTTSFVAPSCEACEPWRDHPIQFRSRRRQRATEPTTNHVHGALRVCITKAVSVGFDALASRTPVFSWRVPTISLDSDIRCVPRCAQ